MTQIPEGANTVHGEGADLKKAILAAAGELGIEVDKVGYKLDMDHFRGAGGRSSVKVIAWASDEGDAADPQKLRSLGEPRPGGDDDGGRERRDRGDRRDRRDRGERRDRGDRGDRRDRKDRRDRGERRERRELRGAEEGTTEASDLAASWLTGLLGFMDLEGTVTGTGSEERVHLAVQVNKAGRLIGRRGATLSAIRHMLKLALAKYGELVIDVDVADERGERNREERPPRRGREGRRSNEMDEETLKTLAQKAAARALETGKVITINPELNSYARRLVHMTVAEIEGVQSRSEEREDGTKVVQVLSEGADEDAS